MKRTWILIFIIFLTSISWSWFKKERNRIETNHVIIHIPPEWLEDLRVESITDEIQNFFEWDIRRVNVYWFKDKKQFEEKHKLGPKVLAAANSRNQEIYIGPKVDSNNFDSIFGHELTHIVVSQKYKKAIPMWLEEGLANFASGKRRVDYKFLAKQKPIDVTSLTHAFKGKVDYKYHYQASTAVMEMIASKCNILELLQLSVGKKLETYLRTYCRIKDLNSEFKKWVKAKSS
jgi:hypothetical protein